MKKKFEVTLFTFGWAITLSSIMLQSLYRKPMLGWVDLLLIFVCSVFFGFFIKDVRGIVISWILSLVLCFIFSFFILALPTFIGIVNFSLIEGLYAGLIVMLFRVMFPNVILITILGASFGGILGEKFAV